jgi:hypothetical protein
MAINFENDAEELPEQGLAQISQLARALRVHKENVANLTQELKAAEKQLRDVEERDLPAAMSALGFRSFTLDSGELVEIKEELYCGIPKAREQEAFGWLRQTGNDSIIKREVTVCFGKGDDDAADSAVDLITDKFQTAAVTGKQSVHPSTLKAFLKEQLEEGVDVPKELFGVYEVKRANIKSK